MHLKFDFKLALNFSTLGQTKLKKVSGPPAWSIFNQVKTHRQTDR